MTNTWFIAETNWNDHTTMSNEKIRELINTWNKVVQTHDTVYHLGNVFGDNKFSYEFQKELNGYKILRKGTLDHSSKIGIGLYTLMKSMMRIFYMKVNYALAINL